MPVLAPGVAWLRTCSPLSKTCTWPPIGCAARSPEPGSDDEKARRYAEFVDRELQRHLSDTEILPHRVGAPVEVSWRRARYWRKRGLSI